MHVNRKSHRRIATLALAAGAAAGIMLLPVGQGVAGASAGVSVVPAAVGYVSGEKPTLGCEDRGCRRNWWGWGRRWCGGNCGHHHRHHGFRHHHDFEHHDHGNRHEEQRPPVQREQPPQEPPQQPVMPEKPEHDKPEKPDGGWEDGWGDWVPFDGEEEEG